MVNKFIKKLNSVWVCVLLSGCAAVVEPISLPHPNPNSKLQEQFELEFLPLTLKVAEDLNSQKYQRTISVPGRAFSARVVDQDEFISDQLPPNSGAFLYKLGIGDEVQLVQSIELKTSFAVPVAPDASSEENPDQALQSSTVNQNSIRRVGETINIITTAGRIGNDGSLFLIGIGRLEAAGRDISELREVVNNILIRTGQTPNFQLDIKSFNSQKAFITTDSPPDLKPDQIQYVLPITDKGVTIREILATAGVPFNEKFMTIVKILRDGKSYHLSLSKIFSETAPDVYLKDKDHVFIQTLEYLDGKVFLVGGIKPQMLYIKPEKRQTLAEALFSNDGPLERLSAQRSAVYVLRGQGPVKAYHLDAQNPARIKVADNLELRPNDIIFVGEQPINTFNRTLDALFPFRIFSRDVKNNNLP